MASRTSKKAKLAAAAKKASETTTSPLLKRAAAPEKPKTYTVALYPSQQAWLQETSTLLEQAIGKVSHRPQMKSALMRLGISLLRKRMTGTTPKEAHSQYQDLLAEVEDL